MTTIANEVRKAAADGITSVLADVRLDTSGDAELAVLPISWAAATTANPSVAVGTTTADNSPTAGTIAKFIFRSGAAATRINGSVGVGSGDWQVSDNVIPGGTTSVNIPGGISLSVSLS
jgi:hypothetical protein